MAYAVSLNGLYYRNFTWSEYRKTGDARCWTREPEQATTWDDRAIPEQIIFGWTMSIPKDQNGKPVKGAVPEPTRTKKWNQDGKKWVEADGAAVIGSMLTRTAAVVEI